MNDIERPNRLLHLRAERDLTQDALATLAGVSKRTVVRVEQGEQPHLRTAYKLARALGVSVDDLFEGAA